MSSRPFKTTLLLVLLAVAAWAVWNYVLYPDADGSVARRGEGGLGGETELPAVDPVLLALQQGTAAEYDPRGRNLFRYEKPPPTPEEIAAREAELERQRRLAEERRKAQEEAARRAEEARKARLAQQQQEDKEIEKQKEIEAAVPKPPEIRLSYVGYVGPTNDRVAVMLDQEGELVVAKEGEVVQEEFRVLRIGFSYLEMGYVNFEGSQPLPLGDEAGRRG